LLRDQGAGCDQSSLVYRLVRYLFGLLAVLVRAALSKDVELVLRHENQVPRVNSVAGRDGTAPTGSGWQRCRG
jgi:hypothetical protein